MEQKVTRRSALRTAAGVGAASLLGAPAAAAAERTLRDYRVLPHQKAKGQLTVAILGSAQSNATVLKSFQQFQKDTGIATTPLFINVSTWVEFFQQVEIRLAGGTPIDTMNMATEGQRLFASKGALEPLNSYIGKDKKLVNEFYKDVNPRTIAQIHKYDSFGGHTYYLPWGYNTMGIWYNRATFKAAGLSDPSPEWTWNDFEAAATKLTQAPTQFGMNLVVDVFQGLEPWIFTNGGQVLNSTWTKCVIDNPAAVEAVAFARNLVAKGMAPAPGGTYNEFTAFSQGTLGMFGAGMWPYNTFIANGGIKNMAIVPWPKKKQQGSPVGTGAFPILKGSQNKDEAWEFVKYSLSPKFQLHQAAPLQGGVPLRNSVARSREFLKPLPPGAEYLVDALNYATPVVGVDNASAVEAALDSGWEQILTGAVSPSAGLRQLQAKCNSLIAA
jgi:multiple sugar transport system substrate-binding protein